MQSDEPQDSIRSQQLAQARELSKQGQWEQAYDIAYKWLKTDPNDVDAIYVIAYIMLNTEKVAIAYPLLKQVTTLEPTNSLGWLNMGMACSDLWRYQEAIRAYKKGIKYAKDDEQRAMQCVNMSSIMVDHGEFVDAEEWARKAIEYNPESEKGKANLGFCQLAQRNWSEGWKNYRYCVNSEWRPLVQYNDEPLWDGESRGKIVVYSEQGLGDEISFGQMVPDMQRWCDENDSKLVVEVNPRLGNLFKRSFPDTEVHGTRGYKQVTWNCTDVNYSIPMAQLGEYFRCDQSQFTGLSYLKADPDRVLQWKALFESKKKPVIGIAWRGGIWKTAAKYRQLDLEQLLPVLKSVDAHWVSLQYKPSQHEIDAFRENHPDIDIVEYAHCTLSQDYDDTVAMIAALDHVVCMQTAVVHVAGGLGVPCWVFVPKTSQWRYGQEGEDFPWANSVRIIRQKERNKWADVMKQTGEELADYTRVSSATGEDAHQQEDQLRNGRERLRGNGRANDRRDGDRPSA